jgi:hypothetical protein
MWRLIKQEWEDEQSQRGLKGKIGALSIKSTNVSGQKTWQPGYQPSNNEPLISGCYPPTLKKSGWPQLGDGANVFPKLIFEGKIRSEDLRQRLSSPRSGLGSAARLK